jgi:hypothetical protein
MFTGAEGHRFKDAATARVYIKNLAMNFSDPSDLSAFLCTCDIAQAALAYLLIEEIRHDFLKQDNSLIRNHVENEPQTETKTSSNEYKRASTEFEHVKEKLKRIISKLNVA